MNGERESLIELLLESEPIKERDLDDDWGDNEISDIAEYLLENGVIVPRKIQGYEDYCIDEYGNIYSLKSHKYLSQQKGKDGYYYVNLCKDGLRKIIAVHRLVAMNFIDNPYELPMVNHKDENRENNALSNLEWCTEKYNTNYGTARERQAAKIKRAVVCIETGEVFLSQTEAGKSKGFNHQHICNCCKGKAQTAGGYHWRYASIEEAEKALKGGVE